MDKIKGLLGFISGALLLWVTCIACSGYHLKPRHNPMAHFGISTLSIPLFINQSRFPNAGALMTQEFIQVLSESSDLSLSTVLDPQADAVLIGVITDQGRTQHTLKGSAWRSSQSVAPLNTSKAIPQANGEVVNQVRDEFLIPSRTDVSANLKLILVRGASLAQYQYLLQASEDRRKEIDIVYEVNIPLNFSYELDLTDGPSAAVSATKSRSSEALMFDVTSRQAAQNFKQTLLELF